jgi:hypothetical protein
VNTVTPPAVPAKEAIPPHRDELAGPRMRIDLPASSRGAVDLLLVFGTMALALGMAAVMASLMLFADGAGDPGRNWTRSSERGVASVVRPRITDHALPMPLVMPIDLAAQAASTALPAVSATGPWASPLYPQNGVTLWDRIRVSWYQDRSAFLLGTAIQLHAPETAATPGPRPTPLSGRPRVPPSS